MFPKIEVEKTTTTIENQPKRESYSTLGEETVIEVPAVDKDGRGVMARLSVEAKPGVGRTLVDINQILLWVDTQDSIRIAKTMAENITGINLSNQDIIYSVQANASAIEGPSAGAALCIATILELENRTPNNKVTITGTLDEKGEIGRISGVLAKAKAAKEAGMDLVLVPKGQKTYTSYSEEKKCEKYVFTEICRTETKPKQVDVEKDSGIKVEEVSSIQEALKYFI
jgi:predicted S18 family serine protease